MIGYKFKGNNGNRLIDFLKTEMKLYALRIMRGKRIKNSYYLRG